MNDAPRTFEEALDRILGEMRQVMIERQHKYGPDNVRRLGILGVLDRAQHDKMARLRRYYEREELRSRCAEAGMPQEVIDRYLPSLAADYDDESLDDAHLDAANYVGVIALMLRRGWWGLKLQSEIGMDGSGDTSPGRSDTPPSHTVEGHKEET